MNKRRFVFSLAILIIIFFIAAFFPFLRLLSHPFRLFGGEKNYLVLLQNNYELRPTGGFITAFATIRLKNGIPQETRFEDVYGSIDDHEYVEPPHPLGELLADPTYYIGHSFRDANVHPDFAQSVKNLLAFYRKTRPFQKFDGVFAVDFAFFESWLSAVGEESDHFFEELTHAAADVDLHNPNQETQSERKMRFQNLLTKLVKKSLLPWNFIKVVSAQAETFGKKHALLYFEDPVLQNIVEQKNWGGRMYVKDGEDFLAIADANYGGLKSNRYVTRDVYYRIDLEAGESKLEVTYRHPGEYNIPLSGDYKGYIRAYVPKNHEPVLEEGILVEEDEKFSVAGKTYFAPIRSSLAKTFSFTFPKSNFRELSYDLKLHKQPGTDADFYRIAVRIPQGMRIRSDDFRPLENIAVFEGFLGKDRKISLRFEKDPLPPRAILQDLKKLNEFVLMWNEAISPDSVKKENFTIEDLDRKNPKSDVIEIKSVSYGGNLIRIHTSGMTRQQEEHYRLNISGIEDFHGNMIQKKSYTFVQRVR